MEKVDVLVVGNGIAGNTAAHTMRVFDTRLSIAIVSDEPHPLYSACLFPDYLSGEIERSRLFLKAFEDYERAKIKLFLNHKVSDVDFDNKVVHTDKGDIGYEKLVLAVGSEPVVPRIEGVGKRGVFFPKRVEDIDGLLRYAGKRVVLVGAGPIGVEFSLALVDRGSEVYLVELMDRVLWRLFDHKPASIIRELLEKQGVKVLTEEAVSVIRGGESVEKVVTTKREIECDAVVIAVGMRPRTAFLRDSEVELGKTGGIVVDEKMRTSVEDVYACGDCIETEDVATGARILSLLWHTAKKQAYVAGCNCVGVEKRYPGTLNFAGVDLWDAYAFSAGATEEMLKDRSVEVEEFEREGFYLKLVFADEVLRGVQFVGEAKHMGFVVSAVRKRLGIEGLRRMEAHLRISPWLYALSHVGEGGVVFRV